MQVTLAELKDLLTARKGAFPITFLSMTEPKMNKGRGKNKNPFLGRVFKASTVNGIINFIYQNSVNNQREREDKTPDFIPEARSWGTRIKGTPFVEHKGEFYLEVKVERTLEEPRYYLDGKEADEATKEKIKEWLPPERESSRQELDKEVILRDYNIKNIVELHHNGEVYRVY